MGGLFPSPEEVDRALREMPIEDLVHLEHACMMVCSHIGPIHERSGVNVGTGDLIYASSRILKERRGELGNGS